MAFAITGRDRGHIVSQTRTRAAGAGLLAGRWIDDGFTDVRIGWDGRSYDLFAFRRLFELTQNGLKPRAILGVKA